jgi:hypothetical protein
MDGISRILSSCVSPEGIAARNCKRTLDQNQWLRQITGTVNLAVTGLLSNRPPTQAGRQVLAKNIPWAIASVEFHSSHVAFLIYWLPVASKVRDLGR